ncbi:MAG: UvrB/UvrC motif-containing protein, partial [Pseudomonadota bacterium]
NLDFEDAARIRDEMNRLSTQDLDLPVQYSGLNHAIAELVPQGKKARNKTGKKTKPAKKSRQR